MQHSLAGKYYDLTHNLEQVPPPGPSSQAIASLEYDAESDDYEPESQYVAPLRAPSNDFLEELELPADSPVSPKPHSNDLVLTNLGNRVYETWSSRRADCD